MIHYDVLRRRLIQRRIELNLAPADVAKRMGIQPGSFTTLEAGSRSNPTTETLHDWCRALESYLKIDAEFYEE